MIENREQAVIDRIAEVHKKQREQLNTEAERKAYDDGVLYAGQFLDDQRLPKGSPTAYSGRDILTAITGMLESGELTESEAEAALEKYKFKFTPAGQAILKNYRLAQAVLAKCKA